MFRPLLASALLVLALPTPATAAPAKVIAFGDSITYGDFDTPDGYGYAGRLGDQLPPLGWNVSVVNAGKNGEKTSGGVSRVDGVIAAGGDVFLLMEGTNDVWHDNPSEISPNTTLFNLSQIALKAEAKGLRVVLATLIPEAPWSTGDPNNVETKVMNNLIVQFALDTGRPLVDTYAHFKTLSNLFSKYYYQPVNGNDPVGHPDKDGYAELAKIFKPVTIAELQVGARIVPPASITAGGQVNFNVNLFRGDYTELEWDFGDGGGFRLMPSGANAAATSWIFLTPGTYTVTLRFTRADQTTGTVTTIVTVNGPAPLWTTRRSLLPLAHRGSGPAPDDLRFDLHLVNGGTASRIVELRLLDERENGPTPLTSIAVTPVEAATEHDLLAALRESVPGEVWPRRRWLVPVGAGGIDQIDLLPSFGVVDQRGALELTYYVPPGVATSGLSASGHLYRDGLSGLGDDVDERLSATWSAGARSISGLTPAAQVELLVAASALGDIDTAVDLHLFDGADAEVAQATIELLKGTTLTRLLDELFPSIGAATGPFRIDFDAATAPYVVEAVAVEIASGLVTALPSSP